MGAFLCRWIVGAGGFIGEITLEAMTATDHYIRGRDKRVYVELTNLHIHPLRRGKGWSDILIRKALGHAQQRGWCVFLRCVPYNKPHMKADDLIAFYSRYGFKSLRGDRREMVLRWPVSTKHR